MIRGTPAGKPHAKIRSVNIRAAGHIWPLAMDGQNLKRK